jgi:transcriptional regulator with XRE-family HTH domain
MVKRQVNPRSAGKSAADMGKRIRLRRVELGMSQDELGEALGVSFSRSRNTRRASTASPHRD